MHLNVNVFHKNIVNRRHGSQLMHLIFLFQKLLYLYTVGFCDQGSSWSSSCDELKNFKTNIFLKLVIKSCTGISATIG